MKQHAGRNVMKKSLIGAFISGFTLCNIRLISEIQLFVSTYVLVVCGIISDNVSYYRHKSYKLFKFSVILY